jgi:hypothetical protein
MILGMSIVVLDWIIRVIYLTLLIPIVILAIRYKYLTPGLKWFFFTLSTHLITALTSEVLYLNNINPNYAASVYYIVAVILYIGFFSSVIDVPRLRNLFFTLAPVHIVFATGNLLFVQKETLNTYSAISLSIIIISLSLFFFYRLLKHLPTDNLLTMPVFWFVTAEFVVNTGQMLMKSFAHFLIDIFNDNLIILWVFHHGLGIAGNLIFIYGACLVFKKLPLAGADGA